MKRNTHRMRIVLALALLIAITAGMFTGCVSQPQPSGPQLQTTSPASEPVPTETEPEETEPPTEPLPPVLTTATITVTGDLLMHKPVFNSAWVKSKGDWDFTPMYQYIAPHIQSADFAVANLETTLCGTENGYEYSGWPRFNCPDAIAADSLAVGFDLLLTANNHCYDTHVVGINRTLDVLAEAGILSLGTRHNAQEPDYTVVEVNGIRIGMTAFTYEGSDGDPDTVNLNGVPCVPEVADMVNSFDYMETDKFYARLQTQIDGMHDQGAQAIVVYIHWGNEYSRHPNVHQTTIAQTLCDMGVDVIVGGHPHVIQPVDLLTGTTDPSHTTLCIYSVGNAVSNQRQGLLSENSTAHTEDGVLFSFTFAKYSDGTVAVQSTEAIPTWVNMVNGPRRYFILPLEAELQESWKENFSLTGGQYNACVRSYERTMELIGSGMEKAQTYYAAADAAKQESLTANPG